LPQIYLHHLYITAGVLLRKRERLAEVKSKRIAVANVEGIGMWTGLAKYAEGSP